MSIQNVIGSLKNIYKSDAKVKKVYKGSDVIWQGLEPYTFTFNKTNFSDAPDYIDYSLMFTTSTTATDAAKYSNSFIIYTSESKIQGVIPVTASTTASRIGQIQLLEKGKFRISFTYKIWGYYVPFKIRGGTRYTSSHTPPLLFEDDVVDDYKKGSIEIDVDSTPYYLNFYLPANKSGSLTLRTSCLYSITIEPI